MDSGDGGRIPEGRAGTLAASGGTAVHQKNLHPLLLPEDVTTFIL